MEVIAGVCVSKPLPLLPPLTLRVTPPALATKAQCTHSLGGSVMGVVSRPPLLRHVLCTSLLGSEAKGMIKHGASVALSRARVRGRGWVCGVVVDPLEEEEGWVLEGGAAKNTEYPWAPSPPTVGFPTLTQNSTVQG